MFSLLEEPEQRRFTQVGGSRLIFMANPLNNELQKSRCRQTKA